MTYVVYTGQTPVAAMLASTEIDTAIYALRRALDPTSSEWNGDVDLSDLEALLKDLTKPKESR